MKKRFTAVILALLIAVSALPVEGVAAEENAELLAAESGEAELLAPEEGEVELLAAEEIDEYSGVNLLSVTTDKLYNAGGGTVAWNNTTNTLTLTNAVFSVIGERQSAIKLPARECTVVLVGENRITSECRGIHIACPSATTETASITVTGEGSLDITAGCSTSSNPYGIGCLEDSVSSYKYTADMIIENGTISIHFNGSSGDGVSTGTGNIIVKGGSLTVDDQGTNPADQGLYTSSGAVRITGGTVNLKTVRHAIHGGAIRIDGGTVTAESTGSSGNGINVQNSNIDMADTDYIDAGCSFGTLIITGGTVKAKGGNYGIYSDYMIRLYGGTVTAESAIANRALCAHRYTPCELHPDVPTNYHLYVPSTSTITPSTSSILDSIYSYTCFSSTAGESITVYGADCPDALRLLTLEGTKGDSYTPRNTSSYYMPGTDIYIYAGSSSNPAFGYWSADDPALDILPITGTSKAGAHSFVMPDHDVTVTAHWDEKEPTKYTVTLNGIGTLASGESSGAGKYAAGATVTLNAGTNTGYSFAGWSLNSGITSSQITNLSESKGATFSMPANDVEITANWVPSEYTVTLQDVGEGASGAGTYPAMTSITINAGTKEGCTFKEWQAIEGTLPSNLDPTSPTLTFPLPYENLTLKAVWEEIPTPTYTITVKHISNENLKDLDTDILETKYLAGASVTLDAAEILDAKIQKEYTFKSWSVPKDDGTGFVTKTENPVTFTMPAHDTTVTVIWDPVLYELTVNGIATLDLGAGQTDKNGSYAKGTFVPLFAGTKEGYTFTGWTTTSPDVTIDYAQYANGASIDMPGHDVTVTANWEQTTVPTYAVTVTGVGSDSTGAGSYQENQSVTVTAGTRPGYTFAGWMVNGVTLTSNLNSPNATFTMPAGAVSLEARWTPNPVNGVTTLYLDELPGPITINYEGYTCENEGAVRHLFYGKSYVLTQKDPAAPTANTVKVVSENRSVQKFDITLRDVNIAGTDAAFSAGYPVNVQLTLEGTNTLQGGANHAGLELLSDTGYDQTTVTVQGQGSLTASGGTGGAGIGGSLGENFGVININGGTVTARGGAGAAGIGGGSCYVNGGTGLGCANSTGNAVYINGGTVSATAGATSGALHGAAGIGTGEGLGSNSSQSGGPYVIVRISGGDTTAQGAGQAPAIGGTYVGNIRITGGTVTTKANPDCTTEIGTYPTVTGSDGAIRQVRLADDSTGQGNAVVYVTKTGVIDQTPTTAYGGDNYNWNGIVYYGSAGQLYVSINSKTDTVTWDSLTVPAGKTLSIPGRVTVKLPAGTAVSGKLAGDGYVQIGELLHYIKSDGTLAPCEVAFADSDTSAYTPVSTLYNLLHNTSAVQPYAAGNHIRLLTDVIYADADLSFPNCSEVELDLNGHTLYLDTHRFNAGITMNSVSANRFTISDSSAEKTGKITGASADALVYSPDGYLTITGGTFTNDGTGPAVEFETTREESSLTGGTFSRIRNHANQGFTPTPLNDLLGSGLAFYDRDEEVWISPASEKAELSHVTIQAKTLPELTVAHETGSQEASIDGLGDAGPATCQWLYNSKEGDEAKPLQNAVGAVLLLDDGTLPGDGYISCLVTVGGETILTDQIFVNATKPALLITIMTGDSFPYDGKPQTPALIVSDPHGQPLQAGKDYVVTYENNIVPGQAYALVTPPEGGSIYFSGTVRKAFIITKASLTIQASDQTVRQAADVRSGASMAQTRGLAAGDTLTGLTVTASGQHTVPSAAQIKNAAGEDVTGCYEITYRPGALTVTGGGSSGGGSSSGGSSGGGSSSSSGSSGSVTRNPDGSTTTTQTDRNTGTVTETTRRPDGSVTTVATAKDGTVTTTEHDGDGARTTTVERTDGTSTVTSQTRDGTSARTEISAQGVSSSTVTLSQQAVTAARNETILLPLPAAEARSRNDAASTVTVTVPGNETVRAEIPVSNPTSGTVAVLVHPDGTEEVIKRTLPGAGSIIVPVQNGATLKLVDNARNFTDVPADHWAAASVDFVSSRELFLGTSETSFSPGRAVTRGMLMTVLARLDGQDTASSGADAWYTPGMNWAVAKGISNGASPEAGISRQQLITMLYRYAGSPTPPEGQLDFLDADRVSGYAQDAMRWAVSLGLLQGKAGGLLDPEGPATRAQVARILENFLTKVS